MAFVAHGDVFAASAKDGGEATRVTTTPELEVAARVGARQPAAGVRLERATAGHIFLYDFGARTETQAHRRPANDVAPRVVAGRQIDRVRPRRAKSCA